MRSLVPFLSLAVALGAASATATESEQPASIFRRGNASASLGRWDDAVADYHRLASEGVRSPALYWNWAQAATAKGRKGEALWALRRGQELSPRDPGMSREIERLRGELGLDPSEITLGVLGELRLHARRFRFDVLAVFLLSISLGALLGKRPRRPVALGCFLAGLSLVAPGILGGWREPRGVVVQRDAPLMDAPRNDAVALANLREGEIVPLLSEEGEYVRIQDASGARGFAHSSDVRKLD